MPLSKATYKLLEAKQWRCKIYIVLLEFFTIIRGQAAKVLGTAHNC